MRDEVPQSVQSPDRARWRRAGSGTSAKLDADRVGAAASSTEAAVVVVKADGGAPGVRDDRIGFASRRRRLSVETTADWSPLKRMFFGPRIGGARHALRWLSRRGSYAGGLDRGGLGS